MAWDCRLVGSRQHQHVQLFFDWMPRLCSLQFWESTGSILLIASHFVILVLGFKVYLQVDGHDVTETIVEGLRKTLKHWNNILCFIFFAAIFFSSCSSATTVIILPQLTLPCSVAARGEREQEMIRVNVMMLKTSGEFHKGQVVFNITYVNGQVYLNDFPMKSGVAHITCQTIILENGNLDNLPDQQRLGTVSVRIMVHEWPLASSSDLQLIVIQEEVIEIDGKQVQQEEVTEIDILVKDLRVLRHSNYTVPLKESMLYSIPRDNDMLFTLPSLSGKDIQDPLQTTSQYLIRQVETTVDEETLPGKLPETPLRIEPPSSYKVMCQWVEDLRKGLCRFWFRSLPIFFSLMEVIVVGVVGAALILKVLKVIFPSCENKGILLLDRVSFVPVITISLPSDLPDRKNNLDEKACT